MSEKLTPLLAQYRRIKEQNPGTLMLFRVGDFYEMFYEDAETGARALGLTLTSRPHGPDNRVPLAGVPAKSLELYVGRLVSQGFRVAVCDQLEAPSAAKPIVKRDVVEVITPGTITRPGLLSERRNNYLLAVSCRGDVCGLSFADVSTGEFRVAEVPAARLAEELQKLDPSEVLIPQSSDIAPWASPLAPFSLTRLDDYYFTEDFAFDKLTSHFGVANLTGFGLGDMTEGVCAAAAVLEYLEQTQKNALGHLKRIAPYDARDFLLIDRISRRNLEILERLHPVPGKEETGTLYWVLDRTKTAAGARLLRRWLLAPLLSPAAINARLDAVEELTRAGAQLSSLQAVLARVGDLERVASRIALERANARELAALRNWLLVTPELRAGLVGFKCAGLARIAAGIGDYSPVTSDIEQTLADDPPAIITEGGLIRPGCHAELDELRAIARDTKQFIARLQDDERRRTGIPNLRVGFNSVFGYYIEVTKSYLQQVPKNYLRKQTVATGERFITPELKEQEEKITHAEERIKAIEYDLFIALRKRVAAHVESILALSALLSELDVLSGFAQAAVENRYVRPVVDDSDRIEVTKGRHPVVERMLDRPFITNDTLLDSAEQQILVITGPNMAGKSTYLRQVALVCIMAQAGSFVPADACRVGIVDKVFTRIGASDDVAQGVSTFLAEMTETANILNNATGRSLLILDEVGRGTATHDGVAIAWAAVEYLHGAGHNPIPSEKLELCPKPQDSGHDPISADGNRSCPSRPRTLFATHYHELTDIAVLLPRVRNFNFSVRETKDDVIFLRKMKPGPASKSYGIAVAKLAGLPAEVIARAREVLAGFEKGESVSLTRLMPADSSIQNPKSAVKNQVDLPLAADRPLDHPALARLRDLNVEELSPLQALNLLAELQRLAKPD